MRFFPEPTTKLIIIIIIAVAVLIFGAIIFYNKWSDDN